MNMDDAILRLDELIEGTLPEDERRQLEQLLESSAELRAELAGLRELRARTAALPRDITPPRELWPGIAAAIESRKLVRPRFGEHRDQPAVGRAPINWRRLGTIAAAAMLLITVSSGITAYLVRSPLESSQTAGTIAPSECDFVAVAWEGFRDAERGYQEITDELLRALEAHRSELSPETVRIVEENLRSIDEAIASARAALERDPSNTGLLSRLTDMYRKRVTFLKEISRI